VSLTPDPAEHNDLKGLHPVDLVLGLVVVSLATALVLLDRLVVPAFARMYADFGGATLPLVTRVVLSHVAPLGGAAGAVSLAVSGMFARKRGGSGLAVGLLLAGITLGVGAAGFCMYALYAPMFELAGKIKP
jgi:hypothetical protein